MNSEQRRRWTILVMGSELTAAQKVVVLALAEFADYDTGRRAYPGEEKLRAICGLKSTRAVNGALSRAMKLGLIEQTSPANSRSGHAATYSLTMPATSGSTTGTAMPVNEDTTGTAVPVDNPTTGTVIPAIGATTGTATHHDRNGHDITTGTTVPTTFPAPSHHHLLVSEPGTSPGQPLADTHTDRPPSRFCDLHPNGTRESCGQCGNARTAFAAWQANRAAVDVAIAAAEDRDRRARRALIAACDSCDLHGRVEIIDSRGNHAMAQCEHRGVPRVGHAS